MEGHEEPEDFNKYFFSILEYWICKPKPPSVKKKLNKRLFTFKK